MQPYQEQPGETPMGVPVIEPGVIKVFGIIHLVFAGLGLIFALVGVIGLFAQRVLSGLASGAAGSGPGNEQMEKMQELMSTMQSEVMLPSILGILFSLILSVLLFLAGLALVKKKKGAVAASNRYAFASIGFKVISIILFFTVVKAAQDRFYKNWNAFLETSGAPPPAGMNDMMSNFGTVAAVAGPVIMMGYPILVLLMLNTTRVKDFLAQHGK